MRRPSALASLLLLAVLSGILLTGCAGTRRIGSWELVRPVLEGDLREVKIIGADRFSWTTFDASGHVHFCGQGRAFLEGKNYVEVPESAIGSIESLIGQPLRFRLEVKGDTLYQYGDPKGPLPGLSEVWKRIR